MPQKLLMSVCLAILWPPYRHLLITKLLLSCRGSSELQNERPASGPKVNDCSKDGFLPNTVVFVVTISYNQTLFRRQLCKRLKKDAVTILFPAFPKYLQKNTVKHKLPTERKTEPSSKIRKAAISDHSYTSREESTSEKVNILSKKVHALQQHLYKQNKKIKSMTDLIQQLKEKSYIVEKQAKLLEFHFSGIAKELFTNQMNNPLKKQYDKYTDETERFAMTLHYYSPKVYNFVWKLLSSPSC